MALSADQYTVAWLCALPRSEQIAAVLVLDERHEEEPLQEFDDENAYFFGSIGGHNIVIACLPDGQPGLVSAARLIGPMSQNFKNLKVYLFVGIGGGIPHDPPLPNSENDIHLGDVVIGWPEIIGAPSIVQWDFGRTLEDGAFQNTSNHDKPDRRLLTALDKLITRDELGDVKFDRHLEKIITQNSKFKHPGLGSDVLFGSDYQHHGAQDCFNCNKDRTISRPSRDSAKLVYHRSTIVSGSSVMKSAGERDKIGKEFNARCFEMEAAGVMDQTRCLVIRGIADYADSHKNWLWHNYAAAAAAAFGKEFLLTLKPINLEKLAPQVPQLNNTLQEMISQMKDHSHAAQSRHLSDEEQSCHRSFKTSKYEEFKNNNIKRSPGTCLWVLDHSNYKSWERSERNDVLWISADPGCGKSVLSRCLVDEALRTTRSRSTCYFFFKDNEQQDQLNIALCALVHQLFALQPWLLKHAVPLWKQNGVQISGETSQLWSILINAAQDEESNDVICVLDALDECLEKDWRYLLHLLVDFHESSSKSSGKSKLKFLVTSRGYYEIEHEFRKKSPNMPVIRLSGENEIETKAIGQEINIVIKDKVSRMAIEYELAACTTQSLLETLLRMKNHTYLWLYLAFEGIEECYRDSLFPDSVSIESLELPTGVENAYEKILGRLKEHQRLSALNILKIIVGAYRPLTTAEMSIALGLAERPNAQKFAEVKINVEVESYIRRLCGLFVFIKNSKVYLLHQTAKEFLLRRVSTTEGSGWKYCFSSIDAELAMAVICMTYLNLSELDDIQIEVKKFRTNVEISKTESGVEAFLDYSATHWASHFRNSPAEKYLLSKATILYNANHKRQDLWFSFQWQSKSYYEKRPNLGVIALAAYNGHDIILHDMLRPSVINLEETDATGRTALAWAADRGFVEVVELLLSHGADPNTSDEGRKIPLHVASERGHLNIVQCLHENGADPNTQDKHGWTPLHFASTDGYLDIVQCLLENGADPNTQDKHGSTPLHFASTERYLDIVQCLHENGADPNTQNKHGWTPLHFASTDGYLDIVQCLHENGADLNIPDYDGQTPLVLTAQRGHLAVVSYLLSQGYINPDIGDKEMRTPLSWAAGWGEDFIVECLLADKRVNVSSEDSHCRTPVMWALKNFHVDCVRLLIRAGATTSRFWNAYLISKAETLLTRAEFEALTNADEDIDYDFFGLKNLFRE